MKLFRKIILPILIICAIIAGLFLRERNLKRPEQLYMTTSGRLDMCLSCHQDVKLDKAHNSKMIGCASCHLGDPLAIEEEKAHAGMVINPGDLRIVEKTCGVEGCHPTDVKKVKNSLMATNRGIIGTLLFYWGESDSQDSDVTIESLLKTGETSLALDYFRKLCATCHLWKQKNDLPGAPDFFNEKGGGCSACHFQLPEGLEVQSVAGAGDELENVDNRKKIHPLITKKVPEDNCIRCHNRSGRIGLSYTGIFEAEGYGTPFEKGNVTEKQLPGARFYLEIAEDIHHTRGMACIDCHTRDEIMGDGTSYAHYEEQLEISCEMCHTSSPGTTEKNQKVTNISKDGSGGWKLTGRVNDKDYKLNLPKKGVCDFNAHERLTCESCHSTWVPQCYGCHAKRDESQMHLDKLTLEETPGFWEEGRSYIRYEKPMLAVWENDVVIVTPGCQDVVTLVDKDGGVDGFNRFTMAAINPHTTQAKGRTCVDCHTSPKTIGLGEGTVSFADGKWKFTGIDQGVDTLVGRTVPLDAYVDIDGVAQQNSSRNDLRPFNGEEIKKILRVGLCVECHDSYEDKMWGKYTSELECSIGASGKRENSRK